MSSIIELRKQELTTLINGMISEVQFFISNKKQSEHATSISQYLEFNEDKLNYVKNSLQTIKSGFNPDSDSFKTFENCINRLKELQREINKIQSRGEDKLSNLEYLAPIKVLTSIVLVAIYIWIWIVYWDWVHGLWYVLMIPMVLSLLCSPFCLILFNLEEGAGLNFSLVRGFVTGLLLAERKNKWNLTVLWLIIACLVVGIPMFSIYFFRVTLGEDNAYVRIEPGEFNMGCSPRDPGCEAREQPEHRVRISRAYEIGKYEVTQRQWEAVMGSNPSHFRGATLPVEQVSWQDAQVFLSRLNARNDGHLYRLPTEAEWEYAARAGTSGAYYGNLDSIAWYHDNSDDETHPVGQKQANAFGLFDMSGNVEEWCQDWQDTYPSGAITDPKGAPSGLYRVFRGGGWRGPANASRTGSRNGGIESLRDVFLGFRVVRQ